ncbi:hypothetical protein PR048_006531 [Dryococelus australis]|uniref:Peptidase S1 domain-containing protein n=1 Tax=Dryococelus australis TaxID=614101 RepID=A0ABQ9IB83_9NEOP|nr:hypothetical protein PR048_006531 [Dryococelus australis]
MAITDHTAISNTLAQESRYVAHPSVSAVSGHRVQALIIAALSDCSPQVSMVHGTHERRAIDFSDESRFCLQHHDGRICIWWYHGTHLVVSCIMHSHNGPAPGVLSTKPTDHSSQPNQQTSPTDNQVRPTKATGNTNWPYHSAILTKHISRPYQTDHTNVPKNASVVIIRVGNTYKENCTKYEVINIIQHPKYIERSSGIPEYYISLLKLKSPLVFSSSVQAGSLPSANPVVKAGTILSVAGWGSTKILGDMVHILREVSVSAMSLEDCAADYGNNVNNNTKICAGYEEGKKDSCQGDSGGALVLGSTQVGIVSWGIGCALENTPGVYTNVGYFRDWIKTETRLHFEFLQHEETAIVADRYCATLTVMWRKIIPDLALHGGTANKVLMGVDFDTSGRVPLNHRREEGNC